MADNKLKPLYKTKNSNYECFCAATGWDCTRATKHFQGYRDFVKRMADNKDNGIFFTVEENLCTKDSVCPVWQLWEKAHQNTQ